MAYLVPDKIIKEDGLIINQKLTPDGYKKKPNRSMTIKGVTVHNTGMITTNPATNPAEQYARATYPNGNMGDVAVHYWVYKNIIWQQLRDNEQGWHAGDTSSRRKGKRGELMSGNLNTISIEIIGNDKESEETGRKLVALLCKRHNLSPSLDVYTHNYWMHGVDKIVPGARKNCPQYILDHWPQFIKGVEGYMNTDKGYFTIGDTGAGVKKLQQDLIALGFNPSGGADGSYGPGTRDTVRAFQAKYKLTVDGMAGPQTLAKINELLKAKEEAGKAPGTKAPEGKLFMVKLGAFQYRENATELVEKANKAGFNAYITLDDDPKYKK